MWKFNNFRLHDTNYIKHIKETIKKCKTEYLDLIQKGLDWEMTKMKKSVFSVPYCVKKKQDRLAFKTLLETELEQIHEIMDVNSSNN